MPFFKFPIMLVLLLVLFSGGRILPFLFVAFGLWMLFGAIGQARRYEPRPEVTSGELDELRSDVAVSLLDLDGDERLSTNPDARSRYRAAGRYYTNASAAVDRGVRRRDRDAVARALYKARYELEATSAELEGRAVPEPPEAPRSRASVAVATRPRSRRRHACCW